MGRTSELHGGKLTAVRCQQLLDNHFGVLHLGGIVLAFLGKTDLLFLELVEHVALRNRTQATYLISRMVGFSLT